MYRERDDKNGSATGTKSTSRDGTTPRAWRVDRGGRSITVEGKPCSFDVEMVFEPAVPDHIFKGYRLDHE